MSFMRTNDFDIFKKLESQGERFLDKGNIYVFRLDGANFRAFTKQFEKPFSTVFEQGMNRAAEYAIKVLPNNLIVYVGSDEISIVCSDAVAETNYGRRINKLLSLTAAHATAGFLNALPDIQGVPAFDSRVIQFKHPALIREYITWRRLDVRKNATSMAAGFLHSHRELMGVSTRERGELLEGTSFEKIDEGTFNGRFLVGDRRESNWMPATQQFAEDLCSDAVMRHVATFDAN